MTIAIICYLTIINIILFLQYYKLEFLTLYLTPVEWLQGETTKEFKKGRKDIKEMFKGRLF